MTSRTLETRLANFTLGGLAIYAPLETYASWGDGLSSPYYLVDLIAMVLLLWGAIHSRRASPHSAPGLLAAGWGWFGANAWRATFDRVYAVRAGGQLEFGPVELWVVGGATAIAIVCLALVTSLTARASPAE